MKPFMVNTPFLWRFPRLHGWVRTALWRLRGGKGWAPGYIDCLTSSSVHELSTTTEPTWTAGYGQSGWRPSPEYRQRMRDLRAQYDASISPEWDWSRDLQ